MSDPQVQPLAEIKLDEKNLYREEVITDLRVGSLKQLTPITMDGERGFDSFRMPDEVWEGGAFPAGSAKIGLRHGGFL